MSCALGTFGSGSRIGPQKSGKASWRMRRENTARQADGKEHSQGILGAGIGPGEGDRALTEVG